MSLPSMPLGGAVQVTAVDDWKFYNVSSVGKPVKPQRIEVRCFKATGKTRADAKSMLRYAR